MTDGPSTNEVDGRTKVGVGGGGEIEVGVELQKETAKF